MANRLKSLIWLKWQYLLGNKVILFVVLSPIVDVYLLWLINGMKGDSRLLSLGMGIIYSVTAGAFVALMVSEEKEKKNIRTLILTGVRKGEYIFSVMLFPMLISVLSLLIFPPLYNVKIENWLTYLSVAIFTAIAYAMINFLIAMFCKTQAQSAMVSMLVMVLGSFFPMLSLISKPIKFITTYSFFGANTDYILYTNNFSLGSNSFLALLVWVIGLAFALRYSFAYNQRH